MISITEKAKDQLIVLMQNEKVDTKTGFVRVGVEGGGCSGLTYQLKFDTELKENDKVFEDKGLKLVVDKKSFLYLD